jgi:hypothetical protein
MQVQIQLSVLSFSLENISRFFFWILFPVFSLEIISRFFYGHYFPDQGFRGLNILCLNILSSVIKTMFSQLNPNVN